MENDLIEAAKNGDIDMVSQSLDDGANINFKDDRGDTALICASGDEDNIL